MDVWVLLWVFLVPRNLADLFIDTEASLFLPILAYGWYRGWWVKLRPEMERFLGIERYATCPHCGETFET